ncbi:MAG TPA: protein kinase, partial [Polyangium sp.]|nr:protein kinase [Polyangium sp.]
IAMEYIEGQTLRALLAQHRGSLPIHEALRITRAIADGLESAHVAGIVHRDLKPENVMLAHNGLVKLLDFGLAKSVARAEPDTLVGDDESSNHPTAEGRVVGTPRYMSPEQVLGRPLDLRSDLFSLGIVLFEMVTGVRPFRGRTTMEVFMAIGRDEPETASTLNPKVPPGLDALLIRCLAKRPEDRFEGAFEIRAAIDDLLAGRNAPASLRRADQTNLDADQGNTISSSGEGFDTPKRRHDSLTRDERALIALILVDPKREPSDPLRAKIAEVLRPELERNGAQVQVLPDGLMAATFSARLLATDHAAHSARSALALHKIAPNLSIALVMGRIEGLVKPLRGDLLEQARALLARVGIAEGLIALDEMTVGLLSAQFEVRHEEQGPFLVRELRIANGMRTLLGKVTPCVGRDRELAELSALFRECIEESLGRAVLIVAPPGIGKSRLARELLQILSQLHGSEISVWMSSAHAQGAGSALSLLHRALRAECGIAGDESVSEQRGKVEKRLAASIAPGDQGRIAEFLGELMQIPFPDDKSAPLRAARQDPELMNEQMRRAFVDFVAAEAAQKPLLIVLEDLHWGDLPTVRFIDAALREHSNKPWMVLALARPEVHDRFPKLWATRDLHLIHLKKLPRKASEQLIRQTLGRGANDAMVTRIVALADGQAFYLEELIRAAAMEPTRAFPATVVAMVQARLMDLNADARRVLRAASVFGEVFWQSAVDEIAGGTTAELLSTLVEQEILVRRVDSKFPGEREYAFRHALLREGAYALLTDGDGVLGHRLAAEWLDLHDEQNPLVLAEHFERGEMPILAARFYREATAQAYYAGDLEAAINHGERGLSCGATGIVREHLLGMMCDAHAQRWNFARAGQIAQELIPHTQPGGMAYVQAAKTRSVIALFSGNFTECMEVVDTAVLFVPAKEAVGALAQMLMMIASVLALIGQSERAEGYVHKLAELCQNAGPESTVAQGWMHFALAFMHLGLKEDPWLALRHAETSRDRFTECGYRKGYANAQIVVGMSAWFLGMAERAERELLDPSASDLDLPEMAAHRASILVDILLARGDLDGARRLASEAVELRHAQQNRSEEGHGRRALALAFYAARDFDNAEREVLHASELLLFPVYKQWSWALLAAIRGSKGQTLEARGLAEQASATCEALRNYSYRGTEMRLILADTLAAAGDENASRQCILDSSKRILATASRIEDLDVRQSYLDKVLANAQTLERARTWGSSR